MFAIKEDPEHTMKRISDLKNPVSTFAQVRRFVTAHLVPKSIFLVAALGAAASTTDASTISINAAANPNNVIQLDGQLSATITHTADGIAIEIPGVQITLDCSSAGASSQSCTVSVGGANTGGDDTGGDNTGGDNTGGDNTGGDNTGGDNTGGDNTGGDNTGGDNTGGALDLDELCASDRPADFSSLQITWDKYCPTYTPTTPTVTTVDPGDNDAGTNDDCPGPGYDCYDHGGTSDSGSDTGYVSQAVPFPAAGGREIDNISPTDFGSAGRNASGGTVYVPIAKGGVVVAGMTMSPERPPVSGRLSFGPTANQPEGADLRLWISNEQDGPRISEACSYTGYAESALRFSMDGSLACNLELGGSYFVNMALCNADLTDYDCRSADALTAEGDATLVFEAKYN